MFLGHALTHIGVDGEGFRHQSIDNTRDTSVRNNVVQKLAARNKRSKFWGFSRVCVVPSMAQKKVQDTEEWVGFKRGEDEVLRQGDHGICI